MYTAKPVLKNECTIQWATPGRGGHRRPIDVLAYLNKKRSYWRELGINLRVDVEKVKAETSTSSSECSHLVFEYWLDGKTALGKKVDLRPHVWATVISALRETGTPALKTLSKELQTALLNEV